MDDTNNYSLQVFYDPNSLLGHVFVALLINGVVQDAEGFALNASSAVDYLLMFSGAPGALQAEYPGDPHLFESPQIQISANQYEQAANYISSVKNDLASSAPSTEYSLINISPSQNIMNCAGFVSNVLAAAGVPSSQVTIPLSFEGIMYSPTFDIVAESLLTRASRLSITLPVDSNYLENEKALVNFLSKYGVYRYVAVEFLNVQDLTSARAAYDIVDQLLSAFGMIFDTTTSSNFSQNIAFLTEKLGDTTSKIYFTSYCTVAELTELAQQSGAVQLALKNQLPFFCYPGNLAANTSEPFSYWQDLASLAILNYDLNQEENIARANILPMFYGIPNPDEGGLNIYNQRDQNHGVTASSIAGPNPVTIKFGADGADVVRGDDGTDRLYGGYGHNQLYAGTGNDLLVSGGGGNLLVAGLGTDTIYAQTGDVINVSAGGTGQGTLALNGTLLQGGVWSVSANAWVSREQGLAYKFDNSGNLQLYTYNRTSGQLGTAVLLTIVGIPLSPTESFMSWLNMGFSNSSLTGGKWNSATNQFESSTFSYSVQSDGSLLIQSVVDSSQSFTLPNASSFLGTAGSSTIHLTDGPSSFDPSYVSAFDAVALMAGPQGLNLMSIAQVNNLVTAYAGTTLLTMLRNFLGLPATSGISDIVSAGAAILSRTAPSVWGASYLGDRATALQYFLKQTDTSTFSYTYLDEFSGFATAPSKMQSIQVYFESAADTNLSVGSGLEGERIYAGSSNTTITGNAMQNDYYVLPGDVVVDPGLRGMIYLPTTVTDSAVSFSANGNDLVINIAGAQSVVVKDMFARGMYYEEIGRGITNGTTTWTISSAITAALNEYANDASSTSQTTLTGHAGFYDSLHAGQGIDTLYGSKVLVDPVTGRGSSAPQTHFYLGSGQDTVYGSGYGYDTIDVTSPLGQAVIHNESAGTTHLNFGSEFLNDTLWVQLQGSQLLITDSEGGSVTVDQGGPTVTLPNGTSLTSNTLYSDAVSASQRKSLYEYLYDSNESGTETQFASLLEGLSSDFTSNAPTGYFDTQLTRAITSGYDVRGIEDGVSSVRYQDGQEIKTYSFSAVERNSAVSSSNAQNSYVWESVTFDLWKDSSGIEHYALDSASTGYGITVDTTKLPMYSESPQQMLLQQRDTRFQLFGTS